MGNAAGSLKKHLETAEKTGALNFTERGIDKFPPELAKVADKLRNLDLSNNKIPSLPANIGAFKLLKSLNISKNRIKELPESFENLIKLEILNLSYNILATVPSGVNKLKNLKEVNLSHNNLVEFPVGFCGLKHLNSINLSNNSLTKIPDSVEGLEATEIIVNQNQVSSVSPCIAACPRLKTLRLEENCLALEAVPSQLFSDSSVSLVSLEGNLFDVKSLDSVPGYAVYMERYTAVKRKLD
ncbi:leucine-rich repeat-containing protein 57 [Eurytemora carolleeae]|uniref:leucine-rich repeat-containing protein 57 n=1 Tax=Eurytemora carolleeae TaxID=1294199 RepID=UPI000C775B67|nr:leucine-rich repeat-containing protein 57 [Eurytemora carolleeae]|eukprot:XP_023332106.1 leucine-rich repeat-containing protein 57-like [Eurytemora affinis]